MRSCIKADVNQQIIEILDLRNQKEVNKMVSRVVMPKLGLTMKEGRITKWLKKEGEHVEKGAPLFAIETEKVTTNVESLASGILRKIVVPVGTVVPVSGLVAYIGEADEELPKEVSADVAEQKSIPVTLRAGTTRETRAATREEAEARISPLARRLALEHNVDLSSVKGSGPGGRVVKEDIMRAVEQRKVEVQSFEPAILETREMSTIRRLTGERLSQMHSQTPHVTNSVQIDLSRVVGLRERLKAEGQEKITFTDIFVKAVALALKDNRILNSRISDNKITILKDINIGVAVSMERGLIVPVIREADRKSLTEISEELRGIVEKARADRLSLDDVQGGTFTVSNMGMTQVDTFSPMINPPECAILGIGRTSQRAWVVEKKLEIRPVAWFSLTFDHRVMDGMDAAKFLESLAGIMNDPERTILA